MIFLALAFAMVSSFLIGEYVQHDNHEYLWFGIWFGFWSLYTMLSVLFYDIEKAIRGNK